MDRPQAYSKYNDLQRADNLFVLENYLSSSRWTDRGGVAVLDVGSGDGRFSVECLLPRLAGTVSRFVGSDVSEAMVRHANERYAHEGREFVRMDVAADAVPDGFEERFHRIFSFYTLHWVRKQRKAFKNMFKMLKPGGEIFLTFLAKADLYQIYQNMSQNEKWKMYSKKEHISPYHGFSKPEELLEKLLISTGFYVDICKTEKREFVYPSFDFFKKSIFSVNPIITKLPQEDILSYTEDFMEEARRVKCIDISSPTYEQDFLTADYEIFVVRAYKPSREGL